MGSTMLPLLERVPSSHRQSGGRSNSGRSKSLTDMPHLRIMYAYEMDRETGRLPCRQRPS